MRSPLSGSIATLVFFVPLVAVPLLAVLGMPQLSSHAATSGDDLKFAAADSATGSGNAELLEPVRVSDSHGDAASGANHEGHSPPRDNDPFAEFNRDSAGSAAQPGSTGGAEPKQPQRWHSEGNGLPQRALFSNERASDDRAANPSGRAAVGSSLDDRISRQPPSDGSSKTPAARRSLPEAEAVVAIDTESAVGSARPSRGSAEFGGGTSVSAETRATAARATSSNHAVAWKRAVGRLNALGIRDFQLQPGEREGEFNFSCRFASRTNPSVIHRFEAEAADPLDAVNQVLRQLDDWRTRRSQRTQASRDAAGAGTAAPSTAESSEVEVTNRAF